MSIEQMIFGVAKYVHINQRNVRFAIARQFGVERADGMWDPWDVCEPSCEFMVARNVHEQTTRPGPGPFGDKSWINSELF